MSFFEFPYTRTYSSDLGWLIRHVKWLTDQVENKTIKYADPINWNITSQYEQNTVVLDGTIAYLSKQSVPSGVSINNTDYWQPIFDIAPIIGDLSNLRDQISAHYETSYTSTRSYDAGDWMFINDGSNDLLYVALIDMTPNTGLVPNVTIKKATVEGLVIACLDEIARVDGDLTTLDGKVGDLADLTTTDKTSIVNAINENAANIVNVAGDVTALDTKVGDLADLNTSDKTNVVNAINETLATAGKIVYNPSDAFSLDATGANDCATILSGISDNVGFKAGSYLIATNCAISCNMLFPEGAKLIINSGVSVKITGMIDAGTYEIFTGAGSVSIEGNSEAYPEWFGAAHDLVTDDAPAIQKAFDSLLCGAVILQAGRYNFYQDSTPTVGYYCGSTININDDKSDVSLKCNAGKAVICSAANVGISINGSTDNGALDFISNTTLENIILYYVGNTVTASAYNLVIGVRVHGGIRNRMYNCEIYKYLTCVYSDTIVAHYIEDCTLHTINTAYGCCIYLNDNVINGAIYPNASFHVDGSILHGGPNSIAIIGNGSTLSDLFVRNNEMGGHFEVISLTISSDIQPMVSALDIHITDNIMDNVVRGIDIYGGGIESASCHIGGNWIANNGDYGILLRAMYNATIEGNIINGVLSSNCYAISLNACKFVTIGNNVIQEFRCGVQTLGCVFITINANTLESSKALNTTGIVVEASCQYVNISNNLIHKGSAGTMQYAINVAGTLNVINWNIKQPAVPNNIAASNTVDGVFS